MTDFNLRALQKNEDGTQYFQYLIGYWGTGFDIFFSDLEEGVLEKNTLGRFTGLKDKNDKDIYEGDIIEINHPDHGTYTETVIFKYGCFCSTGGVSIFDHIWYNYGDDSQENLATVVGNIHENPNLLTLDNFLNE